MGNAMPAKIRFPGIFLLCLTGLSACGQDQQDKLQSQVTGADGRIGPPLAGVGKRWYLAGVLPNTSGNMVAWIMNPQRIDPKTVMPALNVPEGTARDMVAYLYSASNPDTTSSSSSVIWFWRCSR